MEFAHIAYDMKCLLSPGPRSLTPGIALSAMLKVCAAMYRGPNCSKWLLRQCAGRGEAQLIMDYYALTRRAPDLRYVKRIVLCHWPPHMTVRTTRVIEKVQAMYSNPCCSTLICTCSAMNDIQYLYADVGLDSLTQTINKVPDKL